MNDTVTIAMLAVLAFVVIIIGVKLISARTDLVNKERDRLQSDPGHMIETSIKGVFAGLGF